jgi:hypothetical protein
MVKDLDSPEKDGVVIPHEMAVALYDVLFHIVLHLETSPGSREAISEVKGWAELLRDLRSVIELAITEPAD